MSDQIHFRFNQPLKLRIADSDPDCERWDGIMGHYQTVDGRAFALPRPAVVKLLELGPGPGEEIGICKQEGENGRTEWQIWLTAQTEQARAAIPAPQEPAEVPSDELLLLEASVKREHIRKGRNGTPTPIRRKKEPAPAEAPIQPRLFDRGTGTDGPAPDCLPQVAAIRKAVLADRTPYPQMLLHIVRSVEWALREAGVQLGDAPKQDLYSTVYIDAAKRQPPDYDFTKDGPPEEERQQ